MTTIIKNRSRHTVDAATSPTRKEFVDYLAGHAPKGQTALVGVQKSINGPWLAKLPEDALQIADDSAVYLNTSMFVADRFVNRKPSASSEAAGTVAFMLLDDLGTKGLAPGELPIQPSWMLETSLGNYQAGFVFSEQPSQGEYAAAIRAIANAGYCDAGAATPIRWARVPGSVNLKQEKRGFRARPVDWHPECEYTLKEICEAFGVEPGEPVNNSFHSIRIERTNDEVLDWLSEKGLLLSQPNREGWAMVACPWHDEHSNPDDYSAKYHTHDRAFRCFHSHGGRITSQDFLDWVAEQGGPKVAYGPDEQALADQLGSALIKLDPEGKIQSEASLELAKMQATPDNRETKIKLFSRYAFLPVMKGSYFDLESREVRSRDVLNAIYRHLECRSVFNGRIIAATTFFDENREAKGGLILAGLTYAPGEGAIVVFSDDDGKRYGNRWINRRRPVDEALAGSITDQDIEPWLAHGRRLIPEGDELEHVLDVMAFKLQHPELKINHAILIGGLQGSGKDTFFAPFLWAIGGIASNGDLAPNGPVSKADTRTVGGEWGYHLECEVLLINEVVEPKDWKRKELANNLKDVIAPGAARHSVVNRKGQAPYATVNRLLVIATTNDRRALGLDESDRRWFVVWSPATAMSGEEATALHRWFGDGGFQKVAAWLYRRDVSKFNPNAAAPMTLAKQHLIDAGRTPAEAALHELMAQVDGPFSSGIFAGPWSKRCQELEDLVNDTRINLTQGAVLQTLTDAQWVDLGKVKSAQHPTPVHLFVRPDRHEDHLSGAISKSGLRDEFEALRRVVKGPTLFNKPNQPPTGDTAA